jgi:hypothetical protein
VKAEMFVPKVVRRTPKVDLTVKDTSSAIAHELSWHLWPAVDAVRRVVEPAERVYPSEAECNKAREQTVKKALKAFDSSIMMTQAKG